MSITVAIADDHPMMIQGLQHLLAHYSHIVLTDAYLNGSDLLQGLQSKVPDVLLLDIQLPDQSGDKLAPLLLKKYPELRILILTNFDSVLHISSLFRHGVHGYILKTTEEARLIEAIETVYKGEIFIEDSLKEKMERVAANMKKVVSTSSLTHREKEILQLLVNGNTCPQIAAKLFLGLGTVENYRASIMLKLDVNNTAMLVKKALMMGIVE
jgi:DNA-binding NarL/FixJ family response regulator